MSAEPLLTVEDLAKRWKISRRGVYYLLEGQGLPCLRIGPKTLRFDPEAIDQWLADRATPAKAVMSG